MATASLYRAGDVYSRLILTGKGFVNNTGTQPRKIVEYICECGETGWANLYKIKNGHTNSCGCLHNDRRIESHLKHGLSKHLLHYSIWHGMKNRCYNVNDKPYKDYGGRGITVCDEWLNDFMSFYRWAMEHGYRDGLEIERINNNGNYEPSNCKWATRLEQVRNTRVNVNILAFGEIKCLEAWALDNRCNVSSNTIQNRMKSGMNAEAAISKPSRINK